jgi:nucleoside-diphosphate-sugar epimerase
MKRGLVLVTGAGGAVGRQVVQALGERGYEVRAAYAPGEAAAGALVLDPLDAAQVEQAVRGARAVIQAPAGEEAGLPWGELYDQQVRATEVLASAAAQARVDRFVHVSSTAVYGPQRRLPVREDAVCAPTTEEGRARLMAEEQVWQAQRFQGLPAVVLRAAPTYGPWSRGAVANLFALAAVARERSPRWLRRVEGGALSHHVHARDVASAAALLLGRVEAIGAAYNVADSSPLRWGELLGFVCHLCSAECPVVYAPGPLSRAFALAGRWLPSERLLEVNRELASAWSSLRARDGLEERLQPRIGRELLESLGAEEVYDLGALAGLGFQWEHPRTLAGLREVYDWYMGARWLPGRRDLEVSGEAHAVGG